VKSADKNKKEYCLDCSPFKFRKENKCNLYSKRLNMFKEIKKGKYEFNNYSLSIEEINELL
jgi:hypothetical protein